MEWLFIYFKFSSLFIYFKYFETQNICASIPQGLRLVSQIASFHTLTFKNYDFNAPIFFLFLFQVCCFFSFEASLFIPNIYLFIYK